MEILPKTIRHFSPTFRANPSEQNPNSSPSINVYAQSANPSPTSKSPPTGKVNSPLYYRMPREHRNKPDRLSSPHFSSPRATPARARAGHFRPRGVHTAAVPARR